MNYNLANDLNPATDEMLEFGGRNRAKRLARAIRKGKTAKAERLREKVEATVAKLESKGKVDGKRYAFLTQKLDEASGVGLTDAEQEEFDLMQEQVEASDPVLAKEISKMTNTPTPTPTPIIIGETISDEVSKEEDKPKFLGMPKNIGIIVAVVSGLAVIGGTILIIRKVRKK